MSESKPMKTKPTLCQNEKCEGGENCEICINRNLIAKEGYELLRVIENISASVEQTEAVNAIERFIKIAESVLSPAPIINGCGNCGRNDCWFRKGEKCSGFIPKTALL